jgi:hypothetical protein
LRILQRGRGRREPRKVISDFYRINVNKTHSRKFKSKQNVYHVNLKEFPENSPTFVRRLFRDVLKNVKLQMEANPNDYLRVNIDYPSLDSPVWVEFTRSKNLDQQKILDKTIKKGILTHRRGDGIGFLSCSIPGGEWWS